MLKKTLFAATLLLASTALAEEPMLSELTPIASDRVLGGRVFTDPAFMPSAFMTTHFGFRQGVTYLSTPNFPVQPGRSVDANVLGLSERLDAGFKIAKYFELSLFGSSEILAGSDAHSALTSGASFSYSAGLGAGAQLFRSSPSGTQISLRAEGSSGTGGLLDVLRLIDSVSAQPSASTESIVTGNVGRLVLTSTSQVGATGHLLVAQRLTQNLGLQAALGAKWSSVKANFYDLSTNRNASTKDSSVNPDLSAALDVDLAPHVPIGFMFEYSLRDQKQPLAGNDTPGWGGLSHLVAAGIHVVHPALQLGLSVGRIFGLDPIERIDPQGRRLTSGTPYLAYGQVALSFTW
jgi:hypothetical protein